VTRRIRLIQCNSECRHIPQCIRPPSPHRIQTHHTHTATDRPYNKCTRTPKISQSEEGTTTLYIAHPLATTHSAHHQAFKPIEPWNNIVHTAIDSYTGFIISRTHDKHQWLLLQLIILLMMDANCVRNIRVITPNKREKKLYLVGIYMTCTLF